MEATVGLGRLFAEAIDRSAVIALCGPLGAGKTTFVKGLATGLGVKEVVNSPTFTMLNEYHSGRLPLYHLDLYRLSEPGSARESESLARLLLTELEEIIDTSMVCVIEWAELLQSKAGRQEDFLRDIDQLRVDFSYLRHTVASDDGNNEQRVAKISSFGKSADEILKKIICSY